MTSRKWYPTSTVPLLLLALLGLLPIGSSASQRTFSDDDIVSFIVNKVILKQKDITRTTDTAEVRGSENSAAEGTAAIYDGNDRGHSNQLSQISHPKQNKLTTASDASQIWKSAGLESAALTLDNPESRNERSHTSSNFKTRNQCPNDCKCGLVTGVTCYAANDSTILPDNFPRGIQILTLYGYKVIGNKLQELSELKELSIYDGNLIELPELPRSITHLRITNSNLKNLDTTGKLPYLQYLNAAHNNLTEVKLIELTHLLSLDLSNNPLVQVPDLPHSLTILNLKNTILNKQPTTWDIYLPNLRQLVLAGIQVRQPPYLNMPKLEFLDISYSEIRLLPYLSSLPSLKEINLSHVQIYHAIPNHFKGPTNLEKVDLSYTHLSKLPDKLFIHNPNLKELYLHNSDIEYIKDYTLSGLSKLEHLILKNNPKLLNVDDKSLSTLTSLKVFDISYTSVYALPFSVRNVNLTKLIVENVTLLCDCHSHWLPNYFTNIRPTTNIIGFPPLRCHDNVERSLKEFEDFIFSLECLAPDIVSPPDVTLRRGVGKTSLLECNATGTPAPVIIWHTPNRKYYTYKRMAIQPWFSDKFKYMFEHITDETTVPPIDPRIKPLKSGQLLIQNVTRADVGLYRCTAVNAVASVTSTTSVWLTTDELEAFKIETLLFGLACAMTFLLTTLIVQLIRYIMDRMGWECCCCRGRISSKAQQVKRLLESVESYKSQQLDKLKENYNSQVVSIKESCYQQMERLSESYSQQCKNLQSLKDYSAQQLTTARDQYVDQINRVRDYSVGQMNKVSENYVFQRQRIRKFSAHQLLKLRETYKYQQKTLNKILENIPDLYLQNCRTGGGCNRTDSMIFDDEIHGIDAYYRLDFLHPAAPNNEHEQSSDDFYYTPSSTLTRTQRQCIIEQHRRQNSGCSIGGNSTNDFYQEAVQSWTTNTPSFSPGNSPCHTLSQHMPASQHKPLKHTRSLSISAARPSLLSSSCAPTHRRTLSANMNTNPPIKMHRSSPPLVEKTYWTPLKNSPSRGTTASNIVIATCQDSDKMINDSDNSTCESVAMLKSRDRISKDQPYEGPSISSYINNIGNSYIKLGTKPCDSARIMKDLRVDSVTTNSGVKVDDSEMKLIESSDEKDCATTTKQSSSTKVDSDGATSENTSEKNSGSNEKLNQENGAGAADELLESGNALVLSDKYKDSIANSNNDQENINGIVKPHSTAQSPIGEVPHQENDIINVWRESRRKSLSREGSKEQEGRCVLPAVTEDKEPTPSSLDFNL